MKENGDPVEQRALNQYFKFTSGYVAQKYIRKGKRFVCTFQNFIAWDQEISREDELGDPVTINSSDEVPFPCILIQPKPKSK
jgi:hypothetical protein